MLCIVSLLYYYVNKLQEIKCIYNQIAPQSEENNYAT